MKRIGATDLIGGYVGAVPPQESGSDFGVGFTKVERADGWAFYSNTYFSAHTAEEGIEFPNNSYNWTSFRRPKDLYGNWEIQFTLTSSGSQGPYSGSSGLSAGLAIGAMTGTANVGTNFLGESGNGNYIVFSFTGIGATSGTFGWRTGYHTYSPGSSVSSLTPTFSAMQAGDTVGIRRIATRFELYRIRSGSEEILASTTAGYWGETARLLLSAGNVGGNNFRFPYLKWRAQNTYANQRQQDLLNFDQYAAQQTGFGANDLNAAQDLLYFSNTNGYAFYQSGFTRGDFETSVRFVDWQKTGGYLSNGVGWASQLGIVIGTDTLSTITNSFCYLQGDKRFWVAIRETGAGATFGLYASQSQGSATQIATVTRDIVGQPIVKIRRVAGVFYGYLGDELIFSNIESLISSVWNPGWASSLYTDRVICGTGTNANSGVATFRDFQITLNPRETATKAITPRGCFTIKEAYQKAKLSLWVPTGVSSASTFTLASKSGGTVVDYEGYRYVYWVGSHGSSSTGTGTASSVSGSITSNSGGTVEWLLVGGGGAGGYTVNGYAGGGGGAGGVIWAPKWVFPAATTYNVTAGGGGYRRNTNGVSNSGGDSSFHTIIANGGGGGAGYLNAYTAGASGGSAGGSEYSNNVSFSNQTAYNDYTATDHIFSFGNRGGRCNENERSGGGGGAWSIGGDTNSQVGGYAHNVSPNTKYIPAGIGTNGGTGFYLPEWDTATGLGHNGFFASGGHGGTHTQALDSTDHFTGGGRGGGSNGESGGDALGAGSGGGGRGKWNAGSGISGAGAGGCFIIRWRL